MTPPADGEPAPNVRNDESIPSSEVLYRRLSDPGRSMLAIDQVTGVRRPSSGAFKFDADGVSVYRRGVLEQAGLGLQDVITAPQNLVVGVEVGDVRSIGLGAWNDPWPTDVPDPEHPRYAARALLTCLENLGKNARLRRQRRLSGCRRWTSCSGSDTVGAAPRTRGAERLAHCRNGPGVSNERLESVVVEASAATPMATLRSDAIPKYLQLRP